MTDECDELSGRARDICRRTTAGSEIARAGYVERWVPEGKLSAPALPGQLSPRAGLDAEPPSERRLESAGCVGLRRRKMKLRDLVPVLATDVETPAGAAGIKWLAARLAAEAAPCCGPVERSGSLPEYLALDRLAADTLSLIPRLPPDVSVIVGVARSGMAPASILAMYMHRPLYAMTRDGIVDCGHGWRLGTGRPHGLDVAGGTALIVDDTLMTGGSLRQARAIAAEYFPRRLHAHVYVNPRASERPDLFAEWLPAPHLLEWNLFNSLYLAYAAFDFDGIFCRDFTPEEDDDGERYLKALEQMPPLLLPRKAPVHIVTARLEKYRRPTQAWLDRWGVEVASLTMGPWQTRVERSKDSVARWKAEQLLELYGRMKPHSWFGGPLYVESDQWQAAEIATLTGELVVCPPAKRCFR